MPDDFEASTLAVAGKPALPRTSKNLQSLPGTVAHGALMVGGTFTIVSSFNPVVSRIVTDDVYSKVEPPFPSPTLYPGILGAVNRFVEVGGVVDQRLVIVPAQFVAGSTTSTPTTGVQRVYSKLDYEVYHAPLSNTDFLPPIIAVVNAERKEGKVRFSVQTSDFASITPPERGSIMRVVMLYRRLVDFTWVKVELPFDPSTGHANLEIPDSGDVEYFAQVVDGAGNVATGLDYGNPFSTLKTRKVSLPLVRK